MRNLLIAAVATVILLGCDAPVPSAPQGGSGGPPAPPGAPGANVVTITDAAASFGGQDVPFPATRAQLVAALGEPDRTLDKVNKIFVWDQRGIYAYSETNRDHIHDISFSFANEEWDYAPKSVFTGSIRIGGVTITKDTTEADLTTAGFKKDEFFFEKSLGTNQVLVEREGGMKSLSLTVP
jgi:hypothetical protein